LDFFPVPTDWKLIPSNRKFLSHQQFGANDNHQRQEIFCYHLTNLFGIGNYIFRVDLVWKKFKSKMVTEWCRLSFAHEKTEGISISLHEMLCKTDLSIYQICKLLNRPKYNSTFHLQEQPVLAEVFPPGRAVLCPSEWVYVKKIRLFSSKWWKDRSKSLAQHWDNTFERLKLNFIMSLL